MMVKIICAWCGELIRVTDWSGPRIDDEYTVDGWPVSHGMCAACEAKLLADMEVDNE